MNILNNRISDFMHLTVSELQEILEEKYYEEEGTVFLFDKFYNDFKDHFNTTLNKFIDYIDKNKLWTSYEIINNFFYCSADYERHLINVLNDESKEYIPV